MRARIGSISKLLSNDVKRNGQKGKHYNRDPEQMRISVHVRRINGDHSAKGSLRDAQAEAHVGQEDLIGDQARDHSCNVRHNDRDQVGEDVVLDHGPSACTKALGCKVVLSVTDDHDLRTDKVRNEDPVGNTHNEDQRTHAGAENVGKDHGQQEERHVRYDVVDLDHPFVHLLGEAPDRTDRDADDHVDERTDKADDDRVSGARPYDIEHLVADVVGTEDMFCGRLQELKM